jgi:gliding motility-associated-like protein
MNSLPIGMPYGVEFSPDGNFFYGSLRSQGVFQFNTATFSISKVSSTSTSAQGVFQALQLAGNGQIYVARFGQTHLSALNNVDDQAPTWIENTIDWGSSNPNDYCGSGLPNFVQCLTPALTDTCDKVDVRITKEQTGSCCYLVEISNNFEADYFSGVSITSNNLSINSVEKDNSCTWADIVYSSPTQVIFSKAGTSGGIPLNAAGLFQTLGTICFTGSGVDNITVRFITNPPKNDTVCPKIRTIEGCNIPTDTSCVALLNLTAECDGSTPEMKFKIKNNSNFTISSLTLYSQTPGVTVNPQFISIPDLLPGQTSPSFIETALSISNNAGTACFFFEACGRDTTPDSTGQYAIHCCMDSILYCVNIPDCAPCNISVAVTGKDSVNCCYNLTLTSSHQSPIGFVEFKGIGSTRFTLSTSWSIIPPVDSNYVRLQAPEGGISPGTYPDFATFCPKETSTPPHSVQITYSDLKGAIICTDTLIFEACTPSDTNTCCQFSGLIIPNGITPNDDGINDVFEILNVKHCCCISIKVYNRWGNLVYKDGDYKNDWKGTNQSGDKLVQGTYFVIIELPNGSQKGTYIDIRY